MYTHSDTWFGRRQEKGEAPLRYLSVCSGIEAASVAWNPLGFRPVAFAEIEPFPSAALARRYPGVPNLGDITQYEQWNIPSIDILAGGTPCQSFSVAGKRGSLGDERGNLCLTFCAIADKYDPEWILWENVPGVLSTVDNAFGCLLAELCGAGRAIPPANGRRHSPCGVVAGSKRTVAWRVMDAQWNGVPQRRRRVYVLALRGAGNWACADALLPLGNRLPGNLEACRKARQNTACGVGTGPEGSHWDGNAHPPLDARKSGVGLSDQELFAQRGAYLVRPVSPAVTAKWAKGTGGPAGDECQNLVVHQACGEHTLISCFGMYENQRAEMRLYENVQPTIACGGGKAGQGGNMVLLESEPPSVFFYGNRPQGVCLPMDMRAVIRKDEEGKKSLGIGGDGEPSYTLTAQGHVPGVSYSIQGELADGRRQNQNGLGVKEYISYTLMTTSTHCVSYANAVRRLTPLECERLQGFPDNWTHIEKTPGKPWADSHRYKALGNSMAVPVIRWIGERILYVRREREFAACTPPPATIKPTHQ